MSVETASVFASVIKDHLELKAKNAELDGTMPITHYTSDDPFENHPLFKSEEQARLEETMDGTEPAVEVTGAVHPWPGEESLEQVAVADGEESLWGRSRDFDWGD